MAAGNATGGFGESFRHPTLGSAVSGSGADSDNGQRRAQFGEMRFAALNGLIDSVQADGGALG